MIIDRENSYQALEIAESLDNDNELQILLVDRYEDFSFWLTQEEIEKVINHLSKFIKEKEKD